MITAATFTDITGAAAPADLDDVVARVVGRLEDALGRTLALGTRSERHIIYRDGVAYVRAVPVVSVPAGTLNLGDCIGGLLPGWQTVAYTGGYDASSCPPQLAAAIAWGVHTLRHPQGPDPIGAGVTSLQIAGEYQVTREAGTRVGADGEALPGIWAWPIADLGGRCATLAAAYRRAR